MQVGDPCPVCGSGMITYKSKVVDESRVRHRRCKDEKCTYRDKVTLPLTYSPRRSTKVGTPEG